MSQLKQEFVLLLLFVLIIHDAVSMKRQFDWGKPSSSKPSTSSHNNKSKAEKIAEICEEISRFHCDMCDWPQVKSLCSDMCMKPTYARKDLFKCGVKDDPQCLRKKQKSEKRIVGGEGSEENKWPWVVTVRGEKYIEDLGNGRKRAHYKYCGGAILSKSYILTAAHCFKLEEMQKPEKWVIIAGDHSHRNIDKNERSHRVKKIMMHKDYGKIAVPKNDIAILQLKDDIDLSPCSRWRICTPCKDNDIPDLSICYATGWGRVEYNGASSDTLKETQMMLVPDAVCNLPRNVPGGLDQSELCAGWKNANGTTCNGDSGGSLVCKYDEIWYTIGVISWGTQCGSIKNYNPYAVFADMRYFKFWVAETMLTDSDLD